MATIEEISALKRMLAMREEEYAEQGKPLDPRKVATTFAEINRRLEEIEDLIRRVTKFAFAVSQKVAKEAGLVEAIPF